MAFFLWCWCLVLVSLFSRQGAHLSPRLRRDTCVLRTSKLLSLAFPSPQSCRVTYSPACWAVEVETSPLDISLVPSNYVSTAEFLVPPPHPPLFSLCCLLSSLAQSTGTTMFPRPSSSHVLVRSIQTSHQLFFQYWFKSSHFSVLLLLPLTWVTLMASYRILPLTLCLSCILFFIQQPG